MKGKKIVAGALAVMVVLAVLGVIGAAVSAEAEKKSLKRTEDPIVVKASQFAAMDGAAIEKLAVMKWDGTALAPIPFQVDERAPDGRFVYPLGPKANPNDGDKLYNKDDELVMMSWDLGDKVPADAALPCGATRVGELEVKDPKDNGLAWAYVLECASAPPKSTADYAKHVVEAERDWVQTERYHFSEKRGTSFFDQIKLKGDSGAVGPNLVDRIKGRAHIDPKLLPAIDTPESALDGSIQCWIDGPVRVVHLMVAYISLGIIKLNIGGQSENLFYPNYFVTPIQVDMPVNPSSIMKDFNMRYAIDWRKEFDGAKYYDAINSKGVTLDGKTDADEKALDFNAEHDWYALAGPQGSMVVHITMPEQWKNIVKLKLYYVDDIGAPDAPEDDPGQRCAGFKIQSMSDISAGKYAYNIYYMVPAVKPPQGTDTMLDLVKKPISVTGKKIK